MNIQQQWTALTTLWRKETIRYLRIWPQSILPPLITIILYFLIFGHVVGRRVGTMEGFSYMTFIMPGLIMMSVILSSFTNVVSSFYGSRFNRSIEEVFVSPMPTWVMIFGYLGGGLGRGFLIGILVGAAGLWLSGAHVVHPILTLLVFLLSAILFSLAGLINGIFARKFDDTMLVITFLLTPLIYLGGVFYPISRLPPFWRHLSEVNPLHYVISLFRYAMLGIQGVNFWLALSVVVACIVVLLIWCWYMLSRGVNVKS